jgi:dsDNA-specific endonuclease/ATPase MutS2
VPPSPPEDDEPVRIPIEPELDLHPFAPRDIPSVVEEYVNEAHAAGLSELRLVHGRGRGVQRGIVQQALERHPLVISFWDDPSSHLGATVAKLRTSKVERRKTPLIAGKLADCRVK